MNKYVKNTVRKKKSKKSKKGSMEKKQHLAHLLILIAVLEVEVEVDRSWSMKCVPMFLYACVGSLVVPSIEIPWNMDGNLRTK